MTNFLISRQLIIRDLRNEVEARRERGIIAADRRGEKEEINPRERTFRTLGRTAINPNSRLLIMHADELSVARFSGVNQLLLSGRLFPTGESEGRETNPRRTRGCYLPVCQKSRTSPGGWINKLTPRRCLPYLSGILPFYPWNSHTFMYKVSSFESNKPPFANYQIYLKMRQSMYIHVFAPL